MKNWTMIKLLPPKLDGTDLKTDAIWTLYEHEVREEQEYMEKKVEWTSLLSADVTFQKSKPLPPHRQAQCHLRGGIQDVQGDLFVLQLLGSATDRVGTGTQQHGNYWINSMKVIVSVVNSITAFWFCFIWPNYGLPYVCKCDLHLHSSSLLFTLWTPMTKFSPVNLTQDQKATSRPCIGRLYVTGSISFQESTF